MPKIEKKKIEQDLVSKLKAIDDIIVGMKTSGVIGTIPFVFKFLVEKQDFLTLVLNTIQDQESSDVNLSISDLQKIYI